MKFINDLNLLLRFIKVIYQNHYVQLWLNVWYFVISKILQKWILRRAEIHHEEELVIRLAVAIITMPLRLNILGNYHKFCYDHILQIFDREVVNSRDRSECYYLDPSIENIRNITWFYNIYLLILWWINFH